MRPHGTRPCGRIRWPVSRWFADQLARQAKGLMGADQSTVFSTPSIVLNICSICDSVMMSGGEIAMVSPV